MVATDFLHQRIAALQWRTCAAWLYTDTNDATCLVQGAKIEVVMLEWCWSTWLVQSRRSR
jgi:hypothetical protein